MIDTMKAVLIVCLIPIIGIIGSTNAEVCAGCPSQKNPNDPEAKKILLRTVTLQNAKSNDEDINIISIDKVTSQVVSGIKYIYEFQAEGQKSKKQFHCACTIVHQPWISPDPQVLSFKCDPKKSKRNLGSPKDVPPEENDLVKDLVHMGIETLDELDADDYRRIVVKIFDAKKQLVNGIMYDVSVEVKTTLCPEEGSVNEECLGTEVGPRKVCKLQIYRSFADKSPHNAKVVKSECDLPRSDRSAAQDITSTNSLYAIKLAEFAIKRINNALNSITIKGLIDVIESNHLYKSGDHQTSLTFEIGDTNCTKRGNRNNSECSLLPNLQNILLCSVDVIHDEKYENMKLIHPGKEDFNCRTVSHEKILNGRMRRALLGGERELELSKERVNELKDFIENDLTEWTDSPYRQSIANVISASYQIMSGRIVKCIVEVTDTNCLKTENSTGKDCSYRNQDHNICKLGIWEQPWLNSKEVIERECSLIKPTGELLGVEETNVDLQRFKEFASNFDRTYSTVNELKKRFRIFRANMKKAEYLQKTEQGSGIYGASMFADMSSAEFKKNYLGMKKRSSSEPQFTQKQAVIPDIILPEEYDWRHYNIVTPVKNQGLCGSCWAFSVTGNIEGLNAIKTGNLISLSEQELVDCDLYDDGCEGGLFEYAYHAIEEMGGLEEEKDYPYTAKNGKCHFDSKEVRVSISNSVNISHNETDMAKWLVSNGPISIALNANAMQFYMGGVSHPLKFLCNPNSLDHGVLLVGYGVHQTKFLHRTLPYWLIKNSWGTRWGESGYYMIYRGDGSCGVNQSPSSAVL